MSAISAFGAILYIGNAESPTSWTKVSEMTQLSGVGYKRGSWDGSSHDTTGVKDLKPEPLHDGDVLTFEGNSVPGDTGQIACKTHFDLETEIGWRVVLPTSGGDYWGSGFLTDFRLGPVPLTGPQKVSGSIQMTTEWEVS